MEQGKKQPNNEHEADKAKRRFVIQIRIIQKQPGDNKHTDAAGEKPSGSAQARQKRLGNDKMRPVARPDFRFRPADFDVIGTDKSLAR